MIYGRRIGRRLTENQKERLSRFLNTFEIKLGEEPFVLKDTESYEDIQMEIGFGTGDHLAMQAEHHPRTLFLGCEPFLNGIVALELKMEQKGLSNVRVFKDDASLLLRALPDGMLSKVFVLFPDPWPKKRHYKRRFISKENLDLIALKLKPKGDLIVATDHTDYAAWIREHLEAHPAFTVQETSEIDSLWVTTRFQEKAQVAGRNTCFFLGKKR
ncbi:MAG: tRNA (guanosine(46)-N7)-methyltransferase TrmB [Alphaproteobacteria bacterium]